MNQENYEVWKFGGASIATPKLADQVAEIICHYRKTKVCTVVSAIGKTTNAMERIVNAYFQEDNNAQQYLANVCSEHHQYAEALLGEGHPVLNELNDLWVEIEWILEEEVQDTYDYLYDQIVSIGELASTKIIYHLLVARGVKVHWLDVRDIILTDNTHRDAKVNWKLTQQRSIQKLKPLWEKYDVVITQGYIASSSENFTTTLGREGSDYTAAILSYCLDASSMHIWKDVPGVLTGDPRLFSDVKLIEKLSYREASEMTYYGAKVIHEKTIKPIQNKGIPLYVRPYEDISSLGTVISSDAPTSYMPVVVVTPHQALLHIKTNDFSFVAENHLADLFALFAQCRIKVNMMRNTAISFTVCTDHIPDRIEALRKALGEQYSMKTEKDLELITLRHATDKFHQRHTKGRDILFEERMNQTIHIVAKTTK